jgi:hypothetical protein
VNYFVSSFVSIVRCITEDRVLCEESTRIDDLFGEEFDDLDFELTLCCFEATHRVAFSPQLSSLTADDYGHMTIEEFIEQFVETREQRDPLFITKRFLMFRDALEEAYSDYGDEGSQEN